MTSLKKLFQATFVFGMLLQLAHADIPTFKTVQQALRKVVKEKNGGFSLNMWATLVDRDGAVRVVTFSGEQRGDQWPGSRVISAQKANTANAFSLKGLALSTSNLLG